MASTKSATKAVRVPVADTTGVPATATAEPAVIQQVTAQKFETAYDTEAVKDTLTEGDAGVNPLQQRIADSGVMFFNSPQDNDQWIGVAPLDEKDYPGVNLGTIRKVPLNPEAIGAGRKVKFPSGDTAVLPASITTIEGVLDFTHPETGERLVEEKKSSKK